MQFIADVQMQTSVVVVAMTTGSSWCILGSQVKRTYRWIVGYGGQGKRNQE